MVEKMTQVFIFSINRNRLEAKQEIPPVLWFQPAKNRWAGTDKAVSLLTAHQPSLFLHGYEIGVQSAGGEAQLVCPSSGGCYEGLTQMIKDTSWYCGRPGSILLGRS